MADQHNNAAGATPLEVSPVQWTDPALPRPEFASERRPAGLVSAAAAVVVVAALSLGQALFLPLALAFILSFLLAPTVSRLQRGGLGRFLSALIAVMLAAAVVVTIALVVAYQVVQLADSLPRYQANIEQKVKAVARAPAGPLNKLRAMFRSIERTAAAPEEEAGPPAPGREERAGAGPALPEAAEDPPATTAETDAAAVTPMSVLRYAVGTTLGPLGSAAVVVVVLMFGLIERNEIRARLVRLLGSRPGQLYISTQALDDASARVSRYLLMQLVINVTYGIPICIGLYFIGVPSPFFWGLLTMVLRFIPYVGPLVGGALPALLALAVDSGWSMFLWTLLLFVVVEIISNNIMEPLLYGRSTGISPLGIILSAIFWAWLWGPMGLILATPMTVCLVVLGQYVPGMRLFPLLLGDQPVLPLPARIYQRLLARDADEPDELSRAFLAEHSLEEFYAQVLIPLLVILARESEFYALDTEHREFILERIRELIEDMAHLTATPTPPPTDTAPEAGLEADGAAAQPGLVAAAATGRVLVVPSNGASDELAGRMLITLLRRAGVRAEAAPSRKAVQLSSESAPEEPPAAVCISSLSSTAVVRARRQVVRARALYPDAKIILGLWKPDGPPADFARRLGPEAAVPVVTDLGAAVKAAVGEAS